MKQVNTRQDISFSKRLKSLFILVNQNLEETPNLNFYGKTFSVGDGYNSDIADGGYLVFETDGKHTDPRSLIKFVQWVNFVATADFGFKGAYQIKGTNLIIRVYDK